jgi:cytochrome c-type biogenesis protein CcsB
MTWNSQQLVSVPGAGDPRDLFPSLKSNLLWIHVSCMFISYSVFAMGATFAALYIARVRGFKGLAKLDARFNLRWLDEMSYRFTLLAFPVLTLGIFLGALWADRAWGRYWAWDPKEVWALIVWLVYLAYVHLRTQWSWVGYRPALINLLGFMMVMITFKGVNLLNDIFGLDSIHAYTSGSLKTSDWVLMGTFTAITLALIVAVFLPRPDERELEYEPDLDMPMPDPLPAAAGAPVILRSEQPEPGAK